MASYEIGISGIHAAQKALNVIGNNLANAATEGYHKQEIDLRPAEDALSNGQMVGQGVEFTGIRRRLDTFLESEMIRYNSTLSMVSRKLDAMRIVESGMGELSQTSISKSLDNYYASIHNLSMRPQDVNYQTSVLSSAETLTNQIRNLASVVNSLQDSMYTEAESIVNQINQLAGHIASMNQEIFTLLVRGQECNNLMDQRDLLIGQLGKLVDLRTQQREYGVVDVSISDMPLVIGSNTTTIQLGMVENQGHLDLGIGAGGSETFETNIRGGNLGAVTNLRNHALKEFMTSLDRLALTLISETNKLHVQGIGSEGSFTSLSGWTMNESSIADFVPPVTSGTIYVRVIDPSGAATRHAVTVDASSTLASVAADLAAIPGLEDATGLNSGRLQIVANTGYQFDFLPGVLSAPTSTTPAVLAGAGPGANQMPPSIVISGQYSGSVNQTYTCTVHTATPSDTLAIGNGTMTLEVEDGSGSVVKTIKLGSEYVPGTAVELENGIYITFDSQGISPGYLNDGDVIAIQALANTDTSGFLAAVGINCFFSGRDASSIDISSDIRLSVSRIAVSNNMKGTDNLNCLAMARLGDQASQNLGGLTIKEFYRQLAVDVGQEISILDMQYENTEGILRSLDLQRDTISGVDVNEQASLMIVYERIFQSMAKYMNTVRSSLDTILSLLS